MTSEHWVVLIVTDDRDSSDPDRHEQRLRIIRSTVDPEAELAFSTDRMTAIRIRDLPDSEVAKAARQLAGQGLDVTTERVSHNPFVINALEVEGPDGRRFALSGVPSVTRASDVVETVLSEYGDLAATRSRTVIDVVTAEGGGRRLDPDASLHDLEVADGDKLRVGYQAVAGASLYATRLAALSLAERQLREFPRVSVTAVNDPDFPTQFEITFTANGFSPPEETVRPFDPPLRDEHAVRISLPPDYPTAFPVIEWLTPIFHPNVVDGRVCVRLNHPDLDTVCQVLIDMASYRIYDVRPEDFGGAGFLDLAAAAWVLSPAGQEKITARGGTAWPATPRARMPLNIQAMDVTPQSPPLPVTITLNTEIPTQSEHTETGGFLLGHVFPKEDRYLVEITELVVPKNAWGTRTTWTLTEESFRELRHRIGDRQLVGWFHTHPSDGSVELSPADRALHRAFFPQPWQVAMLVTRGMATCWFVRDAPGVPEGHFHGVALSNQ